MTLEQAVVILNERKHDDCGRWYLSSAHPGHMTVRGGFYDSFTPFEAIAIAEKYAGGWISVGDRLPEDWISVLIYGFYSEASNICQVVGSYNSKKFGWTDLDGDSFEASHWQLLPEPPSD